MDEARRLARKLARMPLPAIKFAKASLNQQQVIAGLTASFAYNVEAMAALHTSKDGREWMRRSGAMSLKEFLALREAPFKDLG
jgi:enoyl-CoA hydratase/carnithine racemase